MRRLRLSNINNGERVFDPTPAIDMDFASTKTLVDQTSKRQLTTFVRSTTGTYFDSTGVLRSAPINLIAQSENSSAWITPGNATLTQDATIAPDGNWTADQMLETTGTGLHSQEVSDFLFVSGNVYTYSVFVKSINGRNFEIGFPVGFTNRFARFNLQTGVVQGTDAGVTATITAFPNGWYRCSATSTCTTGGGARPANYINNDTFSRSYTGDATKGIFVWGTQLENGSTMGDYVRTTTAANSGPRFDHNPATLESLGLLIEESRANLLSYSEDFGTAWGLAAATRTLNFGAAPNGTLTADKIESTGGGVFRAGAGVLNATTYTYSVFLKHVSGTGVVSNIGFERFGTVPLPAQVGVNLITGAVTFIGASVVSYNILPCQNGWYRVSVTATSTDTTTTVINYASQTGNEFLIWGAQLEQGAFATSYISTSTTALTRSADVCSITGTNFDLLRSNILTYSEELNNTLGWGRFQTNANGNVTTAPNGTVTADEIIEDTTLQTHYITQGIAIIPNETYTYSCYLKAAQNSFAFLVVNGAGVLNAISVNLTTGAVSAAVNAPFNIVSQDVGNGWYRVAFSYKATVTAGTLVGHEIHLSRDGVWANRNYLGNGVGSVYAWGAQLEKSVTMTDYIQSVAARTSAFDACTIDIETAGLMNNDLAGNRTLVSISDGTYNNLAMIVKGAGQPEFRCEVYSGGGAAQSTQIFTTYTQGSFSRVAIAATLNNTNSCFQGTLGTVDTSCVMPVNPNRIEFRDPTGNSAGHPTGHIKRVQFWPLRLGNSNLQRVTL